MRHLELTVIGVVMPALVLAIGRATSPLVIAAAGAALFVAVVWLGRPSCGVRGIRHPHAAAGPDASAPAPRRGRSSPEEVS